jgi:hypothetical protein
VVIAEAKNIVAKKVSVRSERARIIGPLGVYGKSMF